MNLNQDSESADHESGDSRKRPGVRFVLLLVIVAVIAVGFIVLRDKLRLDWLAERESELKETLRTRPILSLSIAFLIYTVVIALSVPGAAAMSLAYAWLFDFWIALVLVSFASTTGATLAFLLSRYLLGEWIQDRYGDRLAKFNRAIEREGAFYLFTLRLTPLVPFFVINAVMGLTKIRVRTFWIVSQIGMLPGTAVYVYAGSQVPSLSELSEQGVSSVMKSEIVIALVLLGVAPLMLKKMIDLVRRRQGKPVLSARDDESHDTSDDW